MTYIKISTYAGEQVCIKDVHLRAWHEQFFVCHRMVYFLCEHMACKCLFKTPTESYNRSLSLFLSLTHLTLQVSSGTAHSKGSTYTHNSNEIHSGMRFTLAKALSQQEDMRWKYHNSRLQMSGGPNDHQVLHQGLK